MTMPTREDVALAYHELLRRAPEDESVLHAHAAAHADVEAMRASIAASPEAFALAERAAFEDSFAGTRRADGTKDLSSLDLRGLDRHFAILGEAMRSGVFNTGRAHYALCLAHGVRQAVHLGLDRIAALEIGVAQGAGLLNLIRAAGFFRREYGFAVDVWGMDNATGLPPLADHRDHPEIWHGGQFAMGEPEGLRARLPPWAHLLIGEAGELLAGFAARTAGVPLGFLSIDVDLHSSTTRVLPVLLGEAERYLPALPVYLDDVEILVSYNRWCGEAAAVEAHNALNPLRPVERKGVAWNIHNFHVCHVLDHPVRTGARRPRLPFEIGPF